MKVLLVYAHPYNKSFNHAILETVQKALISKGHEFKVRDLYELCFNPVLSGREIVNTFQDLAPVDDDVAVEQDFIRWADMIVFIYPMWWAGMPAMMHGYLDRVFSFGFTYTEKDHVVTGLIPDKRIVIINTIGAPKDIYTDNGMIKSIEIVANAGIFNFCGTKVEKFFHLMGIPTSTLEERQSMLEEITIYFSNL